ncbi:MAG: putative bifunctional diguanylate cyclase/phosphodiesterase [Steroidobacterales bacterium]
MRLGVAFVGVGVLALAANFALEQGVLIERTTQITRTAPPKTLPKSIQAVTAPTEDVVVTSDPGRRVVTSEALLLALDRYRDAVHQRVSSKADETEAAYQRSIVDLDRAAGAFTSQAAAISGKPLPKLADAVNVYKGIGEQLVLTADDRREMLAKITALLDSLNGRLKGSLDHSWKVFGRVIARKSLLQLNADLDALRRASAAMPMAEDMSSREMAKVQETERAVAKDLELNERSLQWSEGRAWYGAVRADCSGLAALHESIPQVNGKLRQLAHDFSEQAAGLETLAPGKIEAPRAAAARTIPAARVDPGDPHLLDDPFVVAPSAAILGPAVVESHSVTTQMPQAHSKRVLIAWLSVAAMLLMVCTAVATVLSVVRPVRRLLNATSRVARGDTEVRVPRGGIKELDTLAVAFNAMAEELSTAKSVALSYQQELEAKVAERTHQLQALAEHDPLTDLPNRRQLFVLLNAAIDDARAVGHRVGVFFIDVDNFKYINDSVGHAFGDRVLMGLAKRLQEATRLFGFAARLGGDEFTIVFDRLATMEDISTAGLQIVQEFQRPLSVDGRDLIVSVSVGASIFPDHAQDAEALLKAADAALFRAKALGRSQLSVFTPELLEAAAAKFIAEQGLRRAVERGEFELVFQPEVNVDTLETVLVEALLRWRMPDGRVAAPGEFLAIAEESGLIMEIGDWVLRSAIEAASQWHHGAWPEARVAINVMPRQLLDPGFVNRLLGLLRTHRLPARCIELELTESVLQTGQATIEALKCLRTHGVAIALDDFGTGYSSLASLEELPLSRIKLDRTLVAGIDNSPRAAAIAQAIIGLCQGLNLEITAEGVERPAQFAMLLRHRGMYLQGYLLAHPAPREELMSLMTNVSLRSRELVLRLQLEKLPNVVDFPVRDSRGQRETG